jgi:alpha-L-rhamnosidase
MNKLFVSLFLAAAASATPVHLRCEYLDNPMGIDSPRPHFSWQSDSAEKNWRQAAYRILVSSTPDGARNGKPDVWDSGKQSSDDSNGIAYGGPPLESRRRYYWTVSVWDAKGRVTQAAPVWWEMGLLEKSDWTAKWIAWNDPEEDGDWSAMRWIWLPGQDAFAVTGRQVAVFRLDADVAAKPRNAALYLLVKGSFTTAMNGTSLTAKSGAGEFERQDVTDLLKLGRNTIEVTVTTSAGGRGNAPGRPAALAGLLKIQTADGALQRYGTGDNWQARLESQTEWKPAAAVANLDEPRLGATRAMFPRPAAIFRREFGISKEVKSARLYVTAQGSYRMYLNGAQVGQDLFTPEFTEYAKRVIYQTYDVTAMLARGQNAVGAMLGDGWYASGLVGTLRRYTFLPPPTRLLAQLRIDYADGTHDEVATGGQWKAARSPILRSEIYAGEAYDARLEQPGWNQPGFGDAGWAPAVEAAAPPSAVTSQMEVPVRVVAAVAPVKVTALPTGVSVFDMGQNFAGRVRLKVSGPAGTRIRLRFAEILNPDGSIYTTNLRNADATDTYVLRGGGVETYTPYFTFHGFRYVEMSGYPGGPPPLDAVAGEAISSAGDIIGKLATSDDTVSKMYNIAIWGQRSNFISIPTDCPQRDERLGWTGDAEVFWRTGSFNMDLAAFTRYFMRSMVDAQSSEGSFTNVVPNVLTGYGAPGWADAGVILPWTAWMQYGDKVVIGENWDAMERWMKFIADANPDFIRKNKTGPNFGDWLPAGTTTSTSTTPPNLIGTAYWALIADMMSQMAHATGREADATRYAGVYQNIRAAFQKEYIKEDGVIGNGSQTSYVVALYAKLVPEPLKAAAVNNLVREIEAHGWHLSTGFLGTPYILFVLTDSGHADVAYRLLQNDTFPSWGYMLKKGATTWWERWNGDTGDPAMNSYNHYAFGSVMAWVYRQVAGIDTNAQGPGYKQITIRPRVPPADTRTASPITHARGEFDSVYGKIVSDWTGTAAGPFTLKVTIPPNTSAKVVLPDIPNAQITEGGKRIAAQREAEGYTVAVGSGTYEFRVK